MKTLISIFTILVFSITYAQNETTLTQNNNVLAAVAAFGPDGANIGMSSSIIFNPKKNIEGSVYLFKEWNNTAVFIADNEKKLLLKNINYNIERGLFESQIGKDSIFTFNFISIKEVIINARVFQSIKLPSMRKNKTFEIVYEGDNYSVLKEYYVSITEGSTNPLINRPSSKYVQRSNYYLKEGETISPFKLRKKSILKLVGDDSDKLEAHNKKYRLSYKKDFDVKKMLMYINSN